MGTVFNRGTKDKLKPSRQPTKAQAPIVTTDVDVFAYVDAVPMGDLKGHEIYDHFVEYVYRTEDGRFDHVMVMTKTKNVYLAVVVDVTANAVHGHHLLDLNELYGLTT